MLFSIVFYNIIVIQALLFMLAYLKIKTLSRYVFFCCSLLTILIPSAVRFEIGTDYLNYKDIYTQIGFGTYSDNTEILFYYINLMLSSLGLDFQYLIIITSLIFCFFISLCVKRESSIWFFLFILLFIYLPSYNILRQAISISISCYALYRYFYFNEKISFPFIIVLSSFFHISSILFLLFPFFLDLKLSIKTRFSLILFFYFFMEYFVDIIFQSDFFLNSHYSYYLGSDYLERTNLGSGVGVFFQLFPYFVLIFFGNRIINDDEKLNRLANLSLIIVLCKFLVINFYVFNRVEIMFFVFSAFVYTEVSVNRKRSFPCALLFLYWTLVNLYIFEMSLINKVHGVVPYISVWSGS